MHTRIRVHNASARPRVQQNINFALHFPPLCNTVMFDSRECVGLLTSNDNVILYILSAVTVHHYFDIVVCRWASRIGRVVRI